MEDRSTPLLPHAPQSALRLHRELEAAWRSPPGWRGCVTASSHSVLGLRYMVAAFFFFAVAGLLSMLIRAQLSTRQGAFLDVEQYNQFFTMHGTLMMFLFATPMFEGLGMYFLPRWLGTRELAFPRLSTLGWWCYCFGGAILLLALLAGAAPNGGWFMYTPLSSKAYSPGVNADVWLLGITFIEVSAMAAAVELTVSILRLRAPGMRLVDMPVMAWYLLGAVVMMLLGFPPLILGSLLLEFERAFDWPFFDPLRGGDALLWQHLFWLFGHPEVYIIFLPAAGVISTVLPVMARTTLLGYGAIVAAILALVFLSFGLWVHHMFAVGIPHMALAFFSAASALVAVPTAVQIFLWIGTLWKGRPQLKLPMLYILGFFATFVMGGLTGVMLAVVPFNWQAHDTAFVTAHLHYVLVGGFVFPMLAGLAYWMPFISGRMPIPGIGTWAFGLIFLGFHGTFFLMHLTGLLGMPRRIASYPDNPEWEWLNLISSFFGFVMAIGFALYALGVVLQSLFGARRSRDPWVSGGGEWKVPKFRPLYNFASLPLPGLTATALARGEGALPGAPRGQREIVAVDTVSGAAQFVTALPGNTFLPFATAVAIACLVLTMLAGVYALAAVLLLGIVVLGWRWGVAAVPVLPPQTVPLLPNVHVPLHWDVRHSLTHSGVVALLVADGALYASFLFGMGFLSVVTPASTPPPSGLGMWQAVLGAAVVGLLMLSTWLARAAEAPRAWLGAGVAAACLLMLAILALGLDDPQAHAQAALVAFALGFVAVHTLIAGMLAARTALQRRDGRLDGARVGLQPVWRLWQRYTAGTAAVLWALVLFQRWSL